VLREVGDAHRRLLRELTQRISTRLDAEFTEVPGSDGPRLGVALKERGKACVVELSMVGLLRAVADLPARESLRIRLKAARDRMMFRAPPVPLPRHIEAALDPASSRFQFGGGGFRGGRGRR